MCLAYAKQWAPPTRRALRLGVVLSPCCYRLLCVHVQAGHRTRLGLVYGHCNVPVVLWCAAEALVLLRGAEPYRPLAIHWWQVWCHWDGGLSQLCSSQWCGSQQAGSGSDAMWESSHWPWMTEHAGEHVHCHACIRLLLMRCFRVSGRCTELNHLCKLSSLEQWSQSGEGLDLLLQAHAEKHKLDLAATLISAALQSDNGKITLTPKDSNP